MLKHEYTALPAAVLGALLSVIAPHKALAAIEADRNSAVIFVYQRIGEDSVPSGGITVDQFRDHVSELKAGGYHVLPLPAIVDGMKPGAAPLPAKTVGITFDGAYGPTVAAAQKILDEADMPFAVFFAADQADGGSADHMTWSQLKTLKKDKRVTLGLLPAAYAHMTESDADASSALINRAVSKYHDAFGEDAQFFAWPYGEYSAALKKQVAGYHFRAVFGQQSGVVYPGADMLALPRFTMANDYADLDRFRLTASALPLPVTDVVPDDMVLGAQGPPLIGFTVTPDIKNLSRLSCFISDLGKAPLTRPGGNRVEIRLGEPLQDRRTRVNCTLPDGQGWRWFGMLLLTPGIADDDSTAPPAADDADDEQ